MAVILNNQRSTYGNPYCYYTVEYTSVDNRTPTEVDVTFQVTSRLASGTLGSGVVLKAQIYAGGSWREEVTLKSSGETWSANQPKGKTFTLHIDNLNINMTTLSTSFKVTSNATGQAGGLIAVNCSDMSLPLSPPIFTSYTMTEVNSAISGISGIDTTIATNISKKRINVTYQLDPRTTLVKFEVENGPNGVIKESASNNFDIDFSNTNLYIISANNKAPIVVKVYDDNGNSASSGLQYYNYIPYQPPTIIDNNVIAKRQTRTSSTVIVSLNGTYYNSNDALNQSSNIVVGYKYWENKENPTIPSSYTTIPSASVTKSNGTFSVEDYIIGTSFDVEKTYKVLLKVNDSYYSYELGEPKLILNDEPIWTEFRDRVDFKKITKQDNELLAPVSLYEDATGTGTGSITLKVNDTAISCVNFEYIEVFYRPYSDTILSDYRSGYESAKVYSPNSKKIQLMLDYDNGTYWYHCFSTWTFSTTTLTKNNETRWRFGTSGSPTRTDTTSSDSNIYIYKIVGYK